MTNLEKFLKSKGISEDFLRYIKEEGDFNTIEDVECCCGSNSIKRPFDWTKTDRGCCFWAKIDCEFQKFLKNGELYVWNHIKKDAERRKFVSFSNEGVLVSTNYGEIYDYFRHFSVENPYI